MMNTTVNPVFRFWGWSVMGAPLWWLLGLNLFFYHAFSFVLFIAVTHRLTRMNRPLFLSPSFFFLFSIVIIYAFSLAIHTLDQDFSRVMASAYNLSFWVMGAMLTVALSNAFTCIEDLNVVLKAFIVLATFMGLLAVSMLVYVGMGGKSLVFQTPLYGLGKFFGETTLVQQSLSVILLIFDWFAASARARFNAFAPYPTATAGTVVILLLMTLTYGLIKKRAKSPFFVLLWAANLLALFMSLARMSVLAFVVSLLVVYLLGKKRGWIGILILFSLLILAAPWISQGMAFFWGLREGSGTARIELYLHSLRQLEGVNWITGLGIKPREISAFEFPLGSHSSYVSLLFRTGLFGFAAFILFQVWLLLRWYWTKRPVQEERVLFLFWRGLGWVFFAMAMWMVTEDLDAPQLLAFLYFSLVGLFEGLHKRCIYGPPLLTRPS